MQNPSRDPSFPPFVVAIGPMSWECQEATLYLEDREVEPLVNVPRLRFALLPRERVPEDLQVPIEITFLRNPADQGHADDDDLAAGVMDTCQRWTGAWDGSLVLSSEEMPFPCSDAHTPEVGPLADQVRVEAGRCLRDTIHRLGIDSFEDDACMQVVWALRSHGIVVAVRYLTDEEPIEIESVRGRGANARRWPDSIAGESGRAYVARTLARLDGVERRVGPSPTSPILKVYQN
jgi:hypothetical protein